MVSKGDRTVKKSLKRYYYGREGFTLVELVIVIAIVAILATIITLNVVTALESGRVGVGRAERTVLQVEVDGMMADAKITILDSAEAGWQGEPGRVTSDTYDANDYLRRFPTEGAYSVAMDGSVTCTDYPGVTDVARINV